MTLDPLGLAGWEAPHPPDPPPWLIKGPESAGKEEEEEDPGGGGPPGGWGKFSLEGLVGKALPTGWNSGPPRLRSLAGPGGGF